MTALVAHLGGSALLAVTVLVADYLLTQLFFSIS
jgi:hypothetical protein